LFSLAQPLITALHQKGARVHCLDGGNIHNFLTIPSHDLNSGTLLQGERERASFLT